MDRHDRRCRAPVRRRRPRRARGGPSRRWSCVRRPAPRATPARWRGCRGSSPGSAGCRLTTRSGKPAEEGHREDAHPPGQHDVVGVEAGDDVGEPGVVVGARPRRGRGRRGAAGTPAAAARSSAPASAWSETTTTTCGGQAAVGAGVEDRLQVRAVPGGQDGEPSHHGSTLRVPRRHPHGPLTKSPQTRE